MLYRYMRSVLEDMESLEVMENGVGLCNGGVEQLSNGVKESDHLDVDILEDLDSYMQDVKDRLTISRMVSDSVVKAMVTAITEEAAEEIAQKEREVTKLKEMLHVHHIGSKDGIQQRSALEAVAGHDRIAETLVHLRGTTGEEFKKLKKEIDSMRKRTSVKRIRRLGDGLQDEVSDGWDVERSLDSLKITLEIVYQQVEEMVHLSKTSVYEWHLEKEFKAKVEAEIEALVMSNCIWTVRGNMRDCFYDLKNVNWDGKMKEIISGIREELDAISISLSVSDNGQLSSHGSLEGDEESSNGKKGAGSAFYLKSASLPSTITTTAATLSPSASSSSSLWEEEYGIHDEVEINMEEHLDPVLLKHMNKLINHYKNEITKLKRNHESKIQDLTEQHYSQVRGLLREKGPSLTSKKNKEFDMLRKRISEVISKVDEILEENEEVDTILPNASGSNEESLNSLKDKVELLLSENHQLRDSLVLKKREIECLSLQISEASENLSQHTLAEAKLLKTVGNLKAAMEDAHFEAVIGEDLFADIVGEVVDEIKCIAEESHIMQELCDIIFKDALKGAEVKLSELNIKYIDEYELRVTHEREKRDKEEQLKVEVANKERLRQEVLDLVQEKEQLTRDISKLEQKLAVAVKELRQVEEDRRMLLDVNQEKQIAVSTLKAKERELSEKFESIAAYINGLLKSLADFECRVTQDISGKCSRFKSLTSQSHVLKQKADVLVRRGMLYKQRFEEKCSDLEKAEAEVDLLGDKVETLMNLVEKIYIGLDHYSPILQHYPGITEVLKLVKRELSPRQLDHFGN